MFGGLSTLIQSSAQIGPPPTDVPPPTPVRFPQCNPSLSQDTDSTAKKSSLSQDGEPESSLVRLLQTVHRPIDLHEWHLAALGVHVHADVPAEDLLPDPSYFPTAAGWDGLTMDQARERDPTFRRLLSNGNSSPEARIYVERRNELSVPNQTAFRTVRRLKPEPGKPLIRLGNCYEFFKQMELMAGYWDDTSLPPLPPAVGGDGGKQDGDASAGLLPPGSSSGSPGPEQTSPPAISAAPESNAHSEPASDSSSTAQTSERVTYRRQPGSVMPPEHRHNLVAAFVKLVSYDFGCTVGPSRVEPRLHLREPPPPPSPPPPKSASKGLPPQQSPHKASYFPTGCIFVQRIPSTREAARAGIVEGPLAAVSARNGTSFTSDADARVDLGRELVAALATAQLRARRSQDEQHFHFGEDKWWATAKRWGGGEGGPIGREVEATTTTLGPGAVVGDKDKDAAAAVVKTEVAGSGSGTGASSVQGTAAAAAAAVDEKSSSSSTTATTTHSHASKLMAAISSSGGGAGSGVRHIPVRGQPASKKQRKTPTIYDHYRMVRPPAANWDRKARYEAIGRTRGADYDDIYVFSSLFHHFCIVRVRVPDRLLEVLGGAPEKTETMKQIGDGEEQKGAGRSWGRLEVWRSRWFDLFLIEDRLEAMRELWGVLAWLMRRQEDWDGIGNEVGGGAEKKGSDDSSSSKDVVMKDS